ncbi:cation transporter [Kushneria pakistanensis]|uniref:Cation transporter n=1 Tax=Kushneria pakistanensis TaxID=1508770 RepID=A0ABQ3FES9_9GAMM|nr:sodium:proton antiporter [Kushneria pakistanensis]GHC20754.1 cation transporter [Kushneria pakistanensis]
MDMHIMVLGGIGLLILLVAWLPLVIKRLPLSLPIVCIAVGYGIARLMGDSAPSPLLHPDILERVTEIAVIISLAGAGLRLDRKIGLRRWANTWRLLGITMPLTILMVVLVGIFLLRLPLETALLLGAVIAPTDPVLASDVQVGPPRSGPEDEVRFALTSEAGLNDGLAFPFTYLAIAVATHTALFDTWNWHWLGVDVVWRIALGVAAGWAIGRLLGIVTFRMGKLSLAGTGQGFAALGGTFLTYAAAETLHGYGFIAVFVCALTLRGEEDKHDYHVQLADFSEEIEKLLMMAMLVFLGAAIAGTALEGVNGLIVIAAVVTVFLIRPLTGMIGLMGTAMPWHERGVVSVFGIRGIGSFYYLAYALTHAEFGEIETVWTVVSLIVLISVVFHGVSAGPLMAILDKRRRQKQ